jgi:dephospho-CoA kinase
MLKLLKIAITGGVASGKTSVCKFFQELGAFVVDTDKITHEILAPDSNLGKKIIQEFGSEVLKNGIFDRQIIAKKVFENSKLLQFLEELVHPAVFCRVKEFYTEACKKNKYTFFVVEVPLLFEIQGESFYDYVVTVIADETLSRERFQKKGFLNIEYDRRMKRQLSPNQKAKKSNYIFKNNGSLAELQKQVIALNQILQQSKE